MSLALFLGDRYFQLFTNLRAQVFTIIVSLKFIVDSPNDLVGGITANFSSKEKILAENKSLLSELELVKLKLQRLDFFEQENAQLRLLLKLSQAVKYRAMVVKLSRIIIDGFNQQLIVDQGKRQAVKVGQVLLDVYGLLGQIVLVEDNFSRVLLITDKKSAVPVMVVRNGLQTIAVGVGRADSLELLNISGTMDIKEGDLLVTSELGQRFPAGYQVGVVKEIKQIVGERFMRVIVTPKAHLNSILYALLIWPEFNQLNSSKNKPHKKIR